MTTAKIDFSPYAKALPGEDRAFGGNAFYVDTVPESSWFQNVRSQTTPQEWRQISTYVRQRAGGACEICGSDLLLEAHERWSLDRATKTQKLARLVCVCKLCHLGTHWGLTGNLGLNETVEKHVLSITGWTKQEFRAHLTSRKPVATDASWKLDISMIEAVVKQLQDPAPTVARRQKLMVEERTRTTLSAPNLNLDLAKETRAGYVAYVAVEEADFLGGIPLSDSQSYMAKAPSELPADVPRLALGSFIKAHANPVAVADTAQLEQQLQDRITPRRLVGDFAFLPADFVAKCLVDGILFSVE